MKKRFTEEQIINILKQQEAGIPVKDIIRQQNISEQTFYRWKSKYGGMEIREAQRLKQLEDENRRLKQLVADLTLDNQALKWVVEKNDFGLPSKKK
jgi:putative transposase